MLASRLADMSDAVALRKESVDRNLVKMLLLNWTNMVALRKESVDRNLRSLCEIVLGMIVALRKESVDRNGLGFRHLRDDVSSLSARRAWIEISMEDLEPSSTCSRSPQGERG